MSAPPVENFSTQYQIDTTNDVFKALKLRANLDRQYYDAVKESVQTGGAETLPPTTLRNQDLIEDKFALKDRAQAEAVKIMNPDTATDFINWLDSNGDIKGFLTFGSKFADEVKNLRGVNFNYLKGLWNGFKNRMEKLAESEGITRPLGQAAYVVAPDLIKPDLNTLQTAEMLLLTKMPADAKTIRTVAQYVKMSPTDVKKVFDTPAPNARDELRQNVLTAIGELKTNKRPITVPYEYRAPSGMVYKYGGEEEEKGEYKPNPIRDSIEAQLERMEKVSEPKEIFVPEYPLTKEEAEEYNEEKLEKMAPKTEKEIRNAQESIKVGTDEIIGTLKNGGVLTQEEYEQLQSLGKNAFGIRRKESLDMLKESIPTIRRIAKMRILLNRKAEKLAMEKKEQDAKVMSQFLNAAQQAAAIRRLKEYEVEERRIQAQLNDYVFKQRILLDKNEKIVNQEALLERQRTGRRLSERMGTVPPSQMERIERGLEEYPEEFIAFSSAETPPESRRGSFKFGSPRHLDIGTQAAKDIAAVKLGQYLTPAVAEQKEPSVTNLSQNDYSRLNKLIEDLAENKPLTTIQERILKEASTDAYNAYDSGEYQLAAQYLQNDKDAYESQFESFEMKEETVAPKSSPILSPKTAAMQKKVYSYLTAERTPIEHKTSLSSPESSPESSPKKSLSRKSSSEYSSSGSEEETVTKKEKKTPYIESKRRVKTLKAESPKESEEYNALLEKYNKQNDDDIFNLAKANKEAIYDLFKNGKDRKFKDTRLGTILDQNDLKEVQDLPTKKNIDYIKTELRRSLAKLEMTGKLKEESAGHGLRGKKAKGIKKAKGVKCAPPKIMKGAKKAKGVKRGKGAVVIPDLQARMQKVKTDSAVVANQQSNPSRAKGVKKAKGMKTAVMPKEKLLQESPKKGGFIMPLLALSGLLGDI